MNNNIKTIVIYNNMYPLTFHQIRTDLRDALKLISQNSTIINIQVLCRYITLDEDNGDQIKIKLLLQPENLDLNFHVEHFIDRVLEEFDLNLIKLNQNHDECIGDALFISYYDVTDFDN